MVKVCPVSGKIRGINFNSRLARWLFPVAGTIALIWFLFRVIPKPSRICYPCQRFAAPIATSFITYIIGLAGSALALGKARMHARNRRAGLALVCVVVAISATILTFTPLPGHDIKAEDTGTFTPTDSPNSPIGVARGINPGRVAWGYDLSACNWDGTSNYWFSNNFNDQAKITSVMNKTICSVAGQATVAASWDALFKYHNGGTVGYVKGEKIAIKINLNNNGDYDNQIDASPQSVYALLDGLVNQYGANQSDITVCDPARENLCTAIHDYCTTAFPNVNYDANLGGWTDNVITYSAAGPTERSISTAIYNTKYLITMALLKRHCTPSATWGTDGVDYGNAPVTMLFKSNWGIIGNNRASMHTMLHDWAYPLASYHLLVDIMGSKYINGKSVLFLLDGLYSGDRWNSNPHKWGIAPFGGHWPSSIFASQDPVALESVGLDFLRAEMPLTKNADRCLHEAALANNPPSGTVYKPDGVQLQSLGVHEHWNNATDKKYSRNLGTGNGIELLCVYPAPAAPASISVSPASLVVKTNASFQFTAIAKDTNGNPFAAQPALTWTVSGGGTINSSGLFSASNSTGGPYTVSASAGGAKGVASITIASAVPVQSANIAVNKATAASSQQTGNGAANGNDGSQITRWCAGGAAFPQWWRVDLGSLYNVIGAKIVWEKATIVYRYRIDVSADSNTWLPMIDKTNNAVAAQTAADTFWASNARFVRLTVTGTSSGDWASFYEFEVYSAASTGVAPPLARIAAGHNGRTNVFDLKGRRILLDNVSPPGQGAFRRKRHLHTTISGRDRANCQAWEVTRIATILTGA